jgi:6-phosphogluconolactonase
MLVYIGTYTQGDSEGIYVYRLDTSSGALEYVSVATGVDNPSFLDLHPQKPYLYAINEISEFDGESSGAITAFSIDEETGQLTLLNQQSTIGLGPCHLSVDATGKFVLVANYGGGSVCMLPIQEDGTLGEATDFIQHEGSSVDPARQQGPHAHSIMIDPANQYAFTPDLGLDKILIYKIDLTNGKLVPNDPSSAEVAPGGGPRHFDFHPNRKYAYVINEMGNTVTAFTYDETNGSLAEIQTIPTLPDGFDGTSHTADVHVSPSGKFLYGSNRGHDSIVIFAIDPETGTLTYVDHESTQGETPRNFAIDSTGTFLLAENQGTDTIVTFRIDSDTGKLTATGHVANVPMPVCLKMRPASQ